LNISWISEKVTGAWGSGWFKDDEGDEDEEVVGLLLILGLDMTKLRGGSNFSRNQLKRIEGRWWMNTVQLLFKRDRVFFIEGKGKGKMRKKRNLKTEDTKEKAKQREKDKQVKTHT
jgi:hypothetical protein